MKLRLNEQNTGDLRVDRYPTLYTPFKHLKGLPRGISQISIQLADPQNECREICFGHTRREITSILGTVHNLKLLVCSARPTRVVAHHLGQKSIPLTSPNAACCARCRHIFQFCENDLQTEMLTFFLFSASSKWNPKTILNKSFKKVYCPLLIIQPTLFATSIAEAFLPMPGRE